MKAIIENVFWRRQRRSEAASIRTIRSEVGWSQQRRKKRQHINIGKLKCESLGANELENGVEGEGKGDSAGDSKQGWYNQVKNKVGALHHTFHQHKFPMNQKLLHWNNQEKIEYHFNNEMDYPFKI